MENYVCLFFLKKTSQAFLGFHKMHITEESQEPLFQKRILINFRNENQELSNLFVFID